MYTIMKTHDTPVWQPVPLKNVIWAAQNFILEENDMVAADNSMMFYNTCRHYCSQPILTNFPKTNGKTILPNLKNAA